MSTKQDPAKKHDYNWVKARRECSLPCEIQKLHDAVQASVEERRKDVKSDRSADVEFKENLETNFSVCHRAFPRYGHDVYDWCVHFTLESDKIEVTQASPKQPRKSFALTLTLNDDGECRYQVDGEGEYLRWQVVRKVLEELYFPSHP